MKPIVSTRRQFLKRTIGLAVSAAVLPPIVRSSALGKSGEVAPNHSVAVPAGVWMMQITLRHANLVPPAVQFAIIDDDPVSGFTATIKRVRQLWKEQFREASDGPRKTRKRSAQMMVAWDSGFRRVTGDRLYLLTSEAPCVPGSNGPGGKKWLVTKVVCIDEEPVCWNIPVVLRRGVTTEVTLTDENTFDLSGAYEAAMS